MLDQEEKVNISLSKAEFTRISKLIELNDQAEKEKDEKEKVQKNSNFVQIYRDHMPELRWLMRQHPFASSLLFFIIEHMDTKNVLAASYAVFQDYFEKGRTTIYRAVKILEENGFIDTMKIGNSNVYIVNHDIAWSNFNDQKKFAKYDGKILVSRAENKDYAYRTQYDRFKALRERENLK